MRSLRPFALGLSIAAALAAPSLAATYQPDPKLLAAAQKEGEVVFYTTQIVDQILRPLIKVFGTVAPGVQVKYVRADGLADGVRQIGDASGLGAVLQASALPIAPREMGLQAALSGGEDYELLFAVSPKLRRRLGGVRRLAGDLPITLIGRLTADRDFVIEANGTLEPLPSGFAHFKA